MSSKRDKKEHIRKLIIAGAKSYKNNLAGKSFCYIYGDECFEVVFETKQFKHLTGVESSVDAKAFYKYAVRGQITNQQFWFSERHPYQTSKEKLNCIPLLSQLTSDVVCVLKGFETVTITYTLGITNLNFTLGLISKSSESRTFIPQTLRIKDKAIEKSAAAEFVDFILMKDGSSSKYTMLSYGDKEKTFPSKFIPFLSEPLQQQMYEDGYIENAYELNQDLSAVLQNAYATVEQREALLVAKQQKTVPDKTIPEPK